MSNVISQEEELKFISNMSYTVKKIGTIWQAEWYYSPVLDEVTRLYALKIGVKKDDIRLFYSIDEAIAAAILRNLTWEIKKEVIDPFGGMRTSGGSVSTAMRGSW